MIDLKPNIWISQDEQDLKVRSRQADAKVEAVKKPVEVERKPLERKRLSDASVSQDEPENFLMSEPEPENLEVLLGMPRPDAFEERSKADAGDTFKEFRKWARKLPVWDLERAAGQLSADTRRNIFVLVARIHSRRLYSAQAMEMLSMLLSLPEWCDGVEEDATVKKVMDEAFQPPSAPASRPAGPDSRRPSAPEVRFSAPLPRPVIPEAPPVLPEGRLTVPVQPMKPPAPAKPAPQVSKSHPSPDVDLRKRVEEAVAILGRGSSSSADDLVRLYRASGLGGQASLSALASDADMLPVILASTGQRLRDLFIDPLHQVAKVVHCPHLYIDLQKRQSWKMPDCVRAVVEKKIRAGVSWTSVEKAHVLRTRHEEAIRYIIAYALARAKASGRSHVWIPMGMNTGAQGHANAVCLQTRGGVVQVYVYDPNFQADQTHWVHSKKAVSDAIPGVRSLLGGGFSISSQAELFGHGLQTYLGTTTTQRGWFSSTVVTTTAGYPICGSIVQLIALVWMMVASKGVLDDVIEVERALSEYVKDGGKAKVQQGVGGMLEGLIHRLGSRGSDPLPANLERRLNKDRRDWPSNLVKGGGSITATIASFPSVTYKW